MFPPASACAIGQVLLLFSGCTPWTNVRSGRHRGRVQPVTEVSLVLLLVLMALLHFSTAQYWHDRGYQPVYGQGYYQDNYGYRPTYGHGYQQYYDDGLYGRHRFRY
ncbi:uncharacterized protein [Procambarus clarkii]|uniref:uncharacterized protein isoform X2 n=1 Tax=Procambarus clarkii TaxID=6728 RepID=UPI003741F5F6